MYVYPEVKCVCVWHSKLFSLQTTFDKHVDLKTLVSNPWLPGVLQPPDGNYWTLSLLLKTPWSKNRHWKAFQRVILQKFAAYMHWQRTRVSHTEMNSIHCQLERLGRFICFSVFSKFSAKIIHPCCSKNKQTNKQTKNPTNGLHATSSGRPQHSSVNLQQK